MKNLFLNTWIKIFLFFLSYKPLESFSANDLPFTTTMGVLKDAISGPFLLSASIIMVVITCLMLAFGEWGDGFKRLINIALWLSIAFSATNFISSLFNSV